MDYRVVVEQRARRDVDEIVTFIASDSPAAAYTWYENIYDHFASLASMPKRCRVAREPELEVLGIRQMSFGNYRILFTVDDDRASVHIHHVRHGARRAAAPADVKEDDKTGPS